MTTRLFKTRDAAPDRVVTFQDGLQGKEALDLLSTLSGKAFIASVSADKDDSTGLWAATITFTPASEFMTYRTVKDSPTQEDPPPCG